LHNVYSQISEARNPR